MSVKSIQAPIGGINRLASIDDMPSSDAYILDNWIPDAGDCKVRGGCKLLANFGSDAIGTLITYGNTFIVCTDGDIRNSGFSPSGGGLPSIGAPSDIGTGFTNDRWEWEVFNDKLLMVNGVDTPQQWDGTTLSAINFTSGLADPADLIGVGSFKGRAIYWKSEPGFYYAEAGSYQGTMAYFDLSTWVSRLANLVLFFTWSADSGDGPDDYAVFVFDSGEALVYQGTDPSSLDFWALIGRYEMGAPLSVRSGASIAGDQIVLTRNGWVNFRVIWESGDWRDDGIGRKIVGLATEAATNFGYLTDWEVHFYPAIRQVIVNIPNGSETFVQHSLSTNTMAWSTLSGWNAATFGEYLGSPYFGDSAGNVYIAMFGNDDDGEPIITDAVPAFNYLSGRSNNKQLTGVRPITTLDNSQAVVVDACADFEIPDAPDINYTPVAPVGTPWGSPWGSPWSSGGTQRSRGQWKTVNAYGYALSYRMATTSKGRPVSWASSQILFRDGGFN